MGVWQILPFSLAFRITLGLSLFATSVWCLNCLITTALVSVDATKGSDSVHDNNDSMVTQKGCTTRLVVGATKIVFDLHNPNRIYTSKTFTLKSTTVVRMPMQHICNSNEKPTQSADVA